MDTTREKRRRRGRERRRQSEIKRVRERLTRTQQVKEGPYEKCVLMIIIGMIIISLLPFFFLMCTNAHI